MGVLVSKGFLIYAENTKDVDYIKQAYALALSIKVSQKTVTSVSLVTNDPVPKKYQKVFDNIIEIPWYNKTGTEFSAEHRWKLYHISPYTETIVLDSDMLLLEDISIWWDYCNAYDIKFCSRVRDYKLDEIYDVVHRKAFKANNLTNPYFALHYFKKSVVAHEFYKVLEFVVNNWAWCYKKFAPEYYQNWLSMDLASAIAIEIAGLHDEAVDVASPLEFIHMKPAVQGWPTVPEQWKDAVPYVFNRQGDLMVGNIKQSRLFHYVDKTFINDDILEKLEGLNA